MGFNDEGGFDFLGAQPVVIILPSTLATDFSESRTRFRPTLAHDHPCSGFLDLTFLDHAPTDSGPAWPRVPGQRAGSLDNEFSDRQRTLNAARNKASKSTLGH
jgi:hypothetical protein